MKFLQLYLDQLLLDHKEALILNFIWAFITWYKTGKDIATTFNVFSISVSRVMALYVVRNVLICFYALLICNIQALDKPNTWGFFPFL